MSEVSRLSTVSAGNIQWHSHEAMACTWGLTIPNAPPATGRAVARSIFDEIDRLERELSRFIEHSDVARVNALSVGASARVGLATIECLELASRLSVETHSTFDVTRGGRRAIRPAVAPARGPGVVLPGLEHLWIDRSERTLTCRVAGITIDLGGIGKGYALDQMLPLLDDWGVTSALLHAGESTVRVVGDPPTGDAWRIGIRDPRNPSGPPLEILSIRDAAVAGSGIDEHGHHIVDPRSGQAVTEPLGAWAVAPSAAIADALSTSFMILSREALGRYCVRDRSVWAARLERASDGLSWFGRGDDSSRTVSPYRRSTMNFAEAMSQLEAEGTEQNRKVYARHGVDTDMFGVSFAALKSLTKQIKTDQPLAQELWESGNHDARVLATMIADPQATDRTTLQLWAADLNNYIVADAFSAFVAKTTLARELADEWAASESDHIGQTAWNLISHLARDTAVPDDYFRDKVRTVETEVHQRKNRTRHAMCMALCAVGIDRETFREAAIEAGQRIGRVDVDHGETDCKTPYAPDYIEKAVAQRAALSAARDERRAQAAPAPTARTKRPARRVTAKPARKTAKKKTAAKSSRKKTTRKKATKKKSAGKKTVKRKAVKRTAKKTTRKKVAKKKVKKAAKRKTAKKKATRKKVKKTAKRKTVKRKTANKKVAKRKSAKRAGKVAKRSKAGKSRRR